MSQPFTPQFLVSSIITLTICGFGLFGNLLCAWVLFSSRMKRSSYVYLLQALTISDISLLLLSSLRTLRNLGLIQLPDNAGWPVVFFFWDWISTSATKYFTVAISIERFFVITYPLEAHKLLTCDNSKYSTLGIFTFCLFLSVFSYIYDWIDRGSFHIYVAVVLHFIPFLTVVVFNVLIFLGLRKIRRASIRKNATQHASKHDEEEENKITKMLFGVVLIFGICYSFEFLRRVMNFAWSEYMTKYNYYDYFINVLADIFYVLNSSVNFVIYCVLGRKFRDVVKEKCCLRREANRKEIVLKNSSDSGNYSGET